MWLNKKGQNKTRLFQDVHENLQLQAGALTWVKNNYFNIPLHDRPDEEDIPAFTNLLTSYLATSFKVGKVKISNTPGCWCKFCTYFTNVKGFELKKLTKRARARADDMIDIYLSILAGQLDIELPGTWEDWRKKNSDLDYEFSLLAYTNELIRRSKYHSQGEGALQLWRDISVYEDGSRIKNFELKLSEILETEKVVIKRLKN